MNKKKIRFIVRNSTEKYNKQFELNENDFPRLKVDGFGPRNIDAIAADLLDIATSVFLIEQSFPGKQHTNRATSISVELGLREPDVWSNVAINTLQNLLFFMGWTHWEFNFYPLSKASSPLFVSREQGDIDKVILFSGGLDSLCGAATQFEHKDFKLVSYYSRQKGLQQELAKMLKMPAPIQWSITNSYPKGRNTSYFYRSLFFLFIAAVTARSYNSNNILQFENGILASGIPPSLSSRSTMHAHHHLHRMSEKIFSEIFGGKWQINNPFKLMTKRQAYLNMVDKLGKNLSGKMTKKTESCWHLYAAFKYNKRIKKNGIPCGFCVPCIIRQTALPQNSWKNLQHDEVRNHLIFGRAFREYYAFLNEVNKVRRKPLKDFYLALGPQALDALSPFGAYQMNELKILFTRFSDEFMSTFKVVQ